jgi:HEAT repeat protein
LTHSASLAVFLWDKDAFVRSATAGALTEITQIELVEDDIYKLDPEAVGSVAADDPEGHISGTARDWWLNTGKKITWPTDNCKPPN